MMGSLDANRHSGVTFPAQVPCTDLLVQRPEVIDDANTAQAQAQQIDQTGADFPHVEPVRAKNTQERQQQPGDGVIRLSFAVSAVC